MMNINKKLFTGLIAFVLALIVAVGMLITANAKRTDTIDQLRQVIVVEQTNTEHYKNLYGEEVAKRKAVEVSKEVLEYAYSDDLKAIKQHLNINSKDIKGVFKAINSIKGEGNGGTDTVIIYKNGDPIKALSVYDTTKWFSINGVAAPGIFNYKYEVRDSITLVPYKVGKALYVKGLSSNPNSTITGLEGIMVAEDVRKKKWGIGPSIQIGYDEALRITPGISVQYSLIRF